jgi:hypothetical protein
MEDQLKETLQVLETIGSEQSQIAELLPLSAAALGMMFGQKQLDDFKESVTNAFASSGLTLKN